MWPLPRIKDEFIQVILHQQHIVLAWIQPETSHRALLNTHEVYEVVVGSQSLMYNPTALRGHIRAFINNHKLHDAYVNFALGPDLVEEQIIQHPNSDAQLGDLIEQQKKQERYYMNYIGPREDQFLFYVCAAAHPLILQLNMLNMQLPVHVQHMSPPLSLQIKLYKHMHGASFNQSRLAQELDITQVRIPSVFSGEFLRRKLNVDRPVTDNDHDLLYALGSFLMGNIWSQ